MFLEKVQSKDSQNLRLNWRLDETLEWRFLSLLVLAPRKRIHILPNAHLFGNLFLGDDGNILVSTTDALAKTTTYGYNENTNVLEWVKYPNDTESTRTEYTYDAWGNVLSITGPMASTMGQHNQLRYRGYVYDPETNLYYLNSRYYNPETGRFINADTFVSTGQGILGNNTFAYCLNNPVNALDPMGEDAIWLQDKNLVAGFGHTGLLIQDADGRWYHFYWGNTGTGILGKSGATAKMHSLESFTYSDLNSLNDYLNDKNIYSGKYEAAIYLKGNFDESVKYAKSLKRNYNLIWNNCLQLSVKVLQKGTFDQSNTEYKCFLNKIISVNPIPNCAYIRLSLFHSSVTFYHAAPWFLKTAYINPKAAVIMF